MIGDEVTVRQHTDSSSALIHITNSAETVQCPEGVVIAWEMYVGQRRQIEMIVMRPQSGDSFR